ncbi:MAG: hypothetical protein H0U28_11455 [Nocardioidaceae bacterium]|nr:hypothetical protein [Nocardioidaceae bacterium]
MGSADKDLGWAPSACTLPTAERPLRVAEFDELFASALRDLRRVAPTRLELEIDAAAEARARDLAARESDCCSFFTFDFTPGRPGRMTFGVTVPATHVDVLDAVADRAADGVAQLSRS